MGITTDKREWTVNATEIYQQTTRHFLRPILRLLDDDSVTEILINGHETVYVERSGKLETVEEVGFPNVSSLMAAARNIAEFAGRPLDDTRRSVDARLPDGSRVHILMPPASRCGICISIRKFSPQTLDLSRLIKLGSLTEEAAEFLALAVAAHRNLLVSGGTGSGKTSLLNALSAKIAADERIVVIEDSSELQLNQPHTLYLEAQPPKPDGTPAMTIRDLFVESLRMRPDRIVVGEIRRGEALDLVQAMLSGHSGCMATIHASTPRDAAVRLETLSLMGGVDLPIHIARSQVASAMQLIVQVNRLPDGRRRIAAISECRGLSEQGGYHFEDIFQLANHSAAEQASLQLAPTGYVPRAAEAIAMAGFLDQVSLTKSLFTEFL